MKLYAILLPIFCINIHSSWAGTAEAGDPNATARAALQAELEDFSKPDWDRRTPNWERRFDHRTSAPTFAPEAGPALTEYREHLTIIADRRWGPVWHQAGTLDWRPRGRQERLAVNVFFPPGPSRGTLLFVHGYLSHAANLAYTYALFTNKGWTVVTLDLPGHGLSTGPRGDIGSFAEYGDAVAAWMDWVWKQNWSGPKVLMAHSLGAAASYEALTRPSTPRPDRVVFCAPLLRPRWYGALALGRALAGWAFPAVPSRFDWDGYLDGTTMPTHWFGELERWLDGLGRRKPTALPLTIYAAGRDKVVDTWWNVSELRRLVPGTRVVELPRYGHVFLASRSEREAFHETLFRDLGL